MASAQESRLQPGTPAPPETLTLERALVLAEESNPRLRVATAQREGSQAAIVTARAYPNPALTILGGRQHVRMLGAAGGVLQHYSASQPIELPSVRSNRITAAQLGLDAVGYNLAEVRLGVRAAVKHAFFEVLQRRGEIELLRENLRLIEDLQRRILLQVQVGEAARLELTRAEAEVATARTFVNRAQRQLLNSIASLRTAVGVPLPNIDPQGKLDTLVRLPPLEEVRETMMKRHPGLSQMQAHLKQAEARLRLEMAQRKPQPELHAEFENQPDLGFFRLGVTIPLPVWNRREGPIAEAVAAVKQAQAMAEARRIDLSADLERAYGQYEVATQQLASLEQGVLKEAEAAVEAAEAAFKFGERGIIEVLDAQRVLRTVRLDYLYAQYDLQAALIDLESLRAIDVR